MNEEKSFKAADPSDYKQKRRIRSILNAKEQVLEIEKEIEYGLLLGHFDEQTGNHALRRAVEHYIFELEPVLKREEYLTDYWGGQVETEDGELVYEAPYIGTMSLPDGSEHEFWGLSDIVNAPHPMVVEWAEEDSNPYDGTTTETRREVVQIPRHILMSAFRLTNSFLFEIKMDLDVDRGIPTFGFEELEDWEEDETLAD